MFVQHTIKDRGGQAGYDVEVVVDPLGFVTLKANNGQTVMFRRDEAEELLTVIDVALANVDGEEIEDAAGAETL